MVDRKTWYEFRKTGLVLLLNQFLHIFGWAIVFDIDQETGEIKDVFPARVKFRGFDNKDTEQAYKDVSRYMSENSQQLDVEAHE